MLNYKQQSIADDVDHGDIDEEIWTYLEGIPITDIKKYIKYKQQSITDDVDHGDIDEDIWNYLEGKSITHIIKHFFSN